MTHDVDFTFRCKYPIEKCEVIFKNALSAINDFKTEIKLKKKVKMDRKNIYKKNC